MTELHIAKLMGETIDVVRPDRKWATPRLPHVIHYIMRTCTRTFAVSHNPDQLGKVLEGNRKQIVQPYS